MALCFLVRPEGGTHAEEQLLRGHGKGGYRKKQAATPAFDNRRDKPRLAAAHVRLP
jgi:hypothetical protein